MKEKQEELGFLSWLWKTLVVGRSENEKQDFPVGSSQSGFICGNQSTINFEFQLSS